MNNEINNITLLAFKIKTYEKLIQHINCKLHLKQLEKQDKTTSF